MKIVLRIYRWIIISLLFQVIILFLINNAFLVKRAEVKATSIEVTGKEKVVVDDDLKVPSGADDIQVSYEAAYVAYLLEGDIQIMDIKAKKNIKTVSSYGNSISYYRWLHDRNMIIFSKASNVNGTTDIQLTTFDIDSGLERDYPKITGLPGNSEVKDIELSALTNVVYVKIKTSDSRMRVYKYNIMNNLSFVMTTDINTPAEETNYNDNLLYQDKKRSKLYILDGAKNTTKTVSFKNNTVLLGIDGEDRVYLGEQDKDYFISRISFGKLNEDIEKAWKKVPLSNHVLAENILISRLGKIYQIQDNENQILNIESGNKISYKGKLIQVLDGFIVTLEGGKLKLESIREQ